MTEHVPSLPGPGTHESNATDPSGPSIPPHSSMSIDKAGTSQCMDPTAPIDGEHPVLLTRTADTGIADAVATRKRSAGPEEVHGSLVPLEGVGMTTTTVPTRVLAQAPVPPVQFLERILVAHNYDVAPVRALQSGFYHRKPNESQVAAYNMELVRAIRSSKLERLLELQHQGASMDACNRFGESVLHMACRRGANSILTFLLNQGLPVNVSDDFGRTPLHDACWTAAANFDIVAQLLNKNRYLPIVSDARGALPLAYIHEDYWAVWCQFLHGRKHIWWHPKASEDWDRHLARNRDSLNSSGPSSEKAAFDVVCSSTTETSAQAETRH